MAFLFRSKKQRGGGGGFRGAISSLMCTFKNALGGGGSGGGNGNAAASSNNNSSGGGGGVRSTIRNSSSGNLKFSNESRMLELGTRCAVRIGQNNRVEALCRFAKYARPCKMPARAFHFL